MPTYEYRCPDGHDFELFQRMSDAPEAVCPECGKDAVRRLSAGAGFLFKGSGFYITDYRSDSYRSAAQAESGHGGEAKAGGDGGKGGEAGKSDVPAKADAPGKADSPGKSDAPAKTSSAGSPPATPAKPARSPSSGDG